MGMKTHSKKKILLPPQYIKSFGNVTLFECTVMQWLWSRSETVSGSINSLMCLEIKSAFIEVLHTHNFTHIHFGAFICHVHGWLRDVCPIGRFLGRAADAPAQMRPMSCLSQWGPSVSAACGPTTATPCLQTPPSVNSWRWRSPPRHVCTFIAERGTVVRLFQLHSALLTVLAVSKLTPVLVLFWQSFI